MFAEITTDATRPAEIVVVGADRLQVIAVLDYLDGEPNRPMPLIDRVGLAASALVRGGYTVEGTWTESRGDAKLWTVPVRRAPAGDDERGMVPIPRMHDDETSGVAFDSGEAAPNLSASIVDQVPAEALADLMLADAEARGLLGLDAINLPVFISARELIRFVVDLAEHVRAEDAATPPAARLNRAQLERLAGNIARARGILPPAAPIGTVRS